MSKIITKEITLQEGLSIAEEIEQTNSFFQAIQKELENNFIAKVYTQGITETLIVANTETLNSIFQGRK